MDRRNFLKGTFGGVAAGGIIIAAGIPDTQAFVEQVKIGDPVAAALAPTDTTWPGIGQMVYNHLGQPVGVVSNFQLNVEPIDVTCSGDEYRSFTAGTRSLVFEVVATGPMPVRLGYGIG